MATYWMKKSFIEESLAESLHQVNSKVTWINLHPSSNPPDPSFQKSQVAYRHSHQHVGSSHQYVGSWFQRLELAMSHHWRKRQRTCTHTLRVVPWRKKYEKSLLKGKESVWSWYANICQKNIHLEGNHLRNGGLFKQYVLCPMLCYLYIGNTMSIRITSC